MFRDLFVLFLLANCAIHTIAYNKTHASDWAKSCAYGCDECPDDFSCGYTYFTTHALKHGSWGMDWKVYVQIYGLVSNLINILAGLNQELLIMM